MDFGSKNQCTSRNRRCGSTAMREILLIFVRPITDHERKSWVLGPMGRREFPKGFQKITRVMGIRAA